MGSVFAAGVTDFKVDDSFKKIYSDDYYGVFAANDTNSWINIYKNVDDDAYIKQLNGYKKYIESITNKNTETYLYSIIDGILIKK